MACHYYLLIAFSDPDAAMAAEQSFAQLPLPLVEPGRHAYVSTIWQTNDKNWVLSVHPAGVSLGVANDPPRLTSADQLDKIAQQLYQQLRQVEDYMCAVAGWEVAELFMPNGHSSYRDLQFRPEVLAETGWDGLVIQETMWMRMGTPAAFEPFAPGHVWRPYRAPGIF